MGEINLYWDIFQFFHGSPKFVKGLVRLFLVSKKYSKQRIF